MQRSILSLILGGGQGARLYPLTALRSKPAVPVAGKYRLIDIPISNCINSDMNRIYVLTQFLSVSLHRHIANTYKFDMFSRGFVEILAAQQTMEGSKWYQGTADAVRQNIRQIEEDPCTDVLILSGDQLYRMDFRDLQRTHEQSDADITIAALPVGESSVAGFGILKTSSKGLVEAFIEKPKDGAHKPFFTSDQWIAERGIKANDRNYLASMGIYLFKKKALIELLQNPQVTDFGKDIFQTVFKQRPVCVHLFDGFWEDLGTIRSYHETALALASDNPPFEFSAPEGVIYTRMRFLPASRISDAKMVQSIISDGCVVLPGARLEHSLLGVRSRIGKNTLIKDTVIIGADRFETDEERRINSSQGRPSYNVGDDCIIERAILDKDCRVGNRVRITNEKKLQYFDGDEYCIRDGIVVIPKNAEIKDGTVI